MSEVTEEAVEQRAGEGTEGAEQEPADTITGIETKEVTQETNTQESVKEFEAGALDPRVFDDKGNFDKSKANDVFKEYAEQKTNYEKQVKDLRRIIGQGKAPENAGEYLKDYKPDSENLARYYDLENEGNKDIAKWLGNATEQFKELGLKKAQAHGVLDILNSAMVDAEVFDTRSDEDLAENAKLWIGDQKTQLNNLYGEGKADTVITSAVKFVENLPIFNEEEKKAAIDLMNTKGADYINLFYKMNKAYGQGDVPVQVSSLEGVPSDAELWDEYINPKTSDTRRQTIMEVRAKAGRKGSLKEGATIG